MNLADLHPDGRRIALKAVECAASGEVLPDDDEFGTICGIDLERFRNVALTLPAATDLTEEQWLALNNAMLWLVAYPHHKDAAMKGFGWSRR
jgi:hypothetical protein